MKVFAVNGSPKPDGNTAHMLKLVLEVCAEGGMETELYQAGGRQVQGCRSCQSCWKDKGRCAIGDWINEVYSKMLEADAIILGSPTFFSDLTPETKAIIDRCGYVAKAAGGALSRKIGAAVSPVRRAGSVHALDSIQHFYLMSDMIVPGSIYWNMSLARKPGEFENDEEGVATMRRLGENIVWLLSKLSK